MQAKKLPFSQKITTELYAVNPSGSANQGLGLL
jgi:hypothetical protein